MTRVVFFGTPAFAVPSLSALLDAGLDVAAVVTQPDRPRGRSHSTLLPPPVKERAIAGGIPVWQPERPRGDEFYGEMRALHADIGVVVAYGHLLKPELLAIPKLGLINVHASLLPRWRGAAPIQWSLLSGDRETGVAIMRIEAGLDTGAVWQTRVTDITAADTTGTLTERLSHLGAAALVEALPRILGGELPIPQPGEGITHAAKVDRTLARVDWTTSAALVSARIRAMDPAPGAWTTLAGTSADLPVKIRAHLVGGTSAGFGTHGVMHLVESGVSVTTGDGSIVLTEVQPAGKRPMPALEWWRFASLADGTRLE